MKLLILVDSLRLRVSTDTITTGK